MSCYQVKSNGSLRATLPLYRKVVILIKFRAQSVQGGRNLISKTPCVAEIKRFSGQHAPSSLPSFPLPSHMQGGENPLQMSWSKFGQVLRRSRDSASAFSEIDKRHSAVCSSALWLSLAYRLSTKLNIDYLRCSSHRTLEAFRASRLRSPLDVMECPMVCI